MTPHANGSGPTPPDAAPCRVRPAHPTDVGHLVALLGVLFEQEAEFEPDASAQRRGLLSILDEPERGRVLVAEPQDTQGRSPCKDILGMVVLLTQVSTAKGGPVGTIEDVVVAPQARGRGIGRALLEAAIAEAEAMGCLRLSLLTDADNAAAQRLYRSLGFTDSPMRLMRRPCPRG